MKYQVITNISGKKNELGVPFFVISICGTLVTKLSCFDLFFWKSIFLSRDFLLSGCSLPFSFRSELAKQNCQRVSIT